jgi:glycosyltransferase involved in cell wall biosynthesis
MSRLLFEVALRRTVRRADVIVCASEVAERAITSAIPRARGRTARVPAVAPAPASADPERLARLGISPPYVLAIASHRPHKRLAELAAAWRRAAPGLPIVIAGTGTKVLEGPPSVRGLGFVEERDLEGLLAGAGALISASLEEGWGLSVFAALASGVPVAACREPTLVEIAGDVASWREPSDLDGLIADAALLAREPSRVADRVAEGRTRAQSFTVERAAQALERLVRSE